MLPADAAKVLDLPPDATPEQIEARFLELRRKLEDKIAKAPTPGLQAKYRESLAEITTAFEALTLAADSSSLPVTTKQGTGSKEPGVTPGAPVSAPASSSPSGLRSQVSGLPTARRKSGSKEFAIVALIALALLGGGGWFVMKTRAENAENERIAAEQKLQANREAEAQKKSQEEEKVRLAAAEKAEKERLAGQLASLKSRFAELDIAYEAVMRSEALAERELADMKSELRGLARDTANAETRRLEQRISAQTAYLAWLRQTLPTHPASVHRARAASLLESRSIAEAAKAVDAYTLANQQLRKDQSAALAFRDQAPEASSSTLVQSTDLRILRRGTLDYPLAMLRREMEGLTRISCIVQPDGKPTDLQIVEATTPEFGKAALKYVATFTFAPATDANGKPVASRYTVPVRFKLN
jgi:TonB family protein